jgi:hypothetical protein
MLDKLLLKAKYKIHNIEIVDISERALGKYRCKIKDNNKESIDTCIHKLIRNWNVGKEFYRDSKTIKRAYGNLTIVFNIEENKIINVYNHYGSVRNEIDIKRKELVSKILGLV